MECILSGGGVLSDLKMTGILVVSLRVKNCRFLSHLAVVDPDLQMRWGGGGGGGAGHPDPGPEIRGGAVSKKNCLRPFGPQFHLKIRGASSPGSTTA